MLSTFVMGDFFSDFYAIEIKDLTVLKILTKSHFWLRMYVKHPSIFIFIKNL